METALETLVHCYSALADETREPDARLSAVVEAWRHLSGIDRTDCFAPGLPLPARVVRSLHGSADLVDPLQVPARLLAHSPSVDVAEIDVAPVQWKGRPALRVRVAAFDGDPFPDDTVDVRVRLVDRRSGEPRGQGLLGGLVTRPAPTPGRAEDRYFEGVVLLPGEVAARDVRVEVDASLGGRTPGSADRDELIRTRRATRFLSDWRTLVADVRLWGYGAAPAARLRVIIECLVTDLDGSDAVVHQPLWGGGPTVAHLQRLVDLGDRRLTSQLEEVSAGRIEQIPGADDGGSTAVMAAVSGPGDLLAAELAAAYERALLP
jgi:hypothetical protein